MAADHALLAHIQQVGIEASGALLLARAQHVCGVRQGARGDGPGWALLPQPGPFVARPSDMVRAPTEREEDRGGPNNYDTRTRPIWFSTTLLQPAPVPRTAA